MRQLLEATSPHARLLVVGDPNQLTSVEAGSVLQDLVTASAETWWKDRVTVLLKTHRYDDTQPLGRLIAAIRDGDGAAAKELLTRAGPGDVSWAPAAALPDEVGRAAERWSDVLGASDSDAHFRLRESYVVLTPFRKGPTGTHRLGAAIENRLSKAPGGKPPVRPIIIEENSAELGVYNGDFAMVRDGETPMAVIPTDRGAPREIAEARLPRYSDAYALSIHKAQGSEFDEVLIVLPEDDAPLLTRELVYTALSRARHRVRIVGPKEVLLNALARRARRDSGLVDAISEMKQD
jgi:exodeoxyribonuclease V alpha subunit